MNPQSVISINPTGNPAGLNIAKELLNGKAIARKPINEMRKVAKVIFGVTTSESDSRRQWTFRLLMGSILMCFGLLFLHTVDVTGAEHVMPGICTLMVACGALVACGLFTRIVSFALAIILVMAACHISMATMTGYALLVCIAACVAVCVAGSGRYSLDTLVYNRLIRNKQRCAF